MSKFDSLKKIPVLADLIRAVGKYKTRVPAGHFYSPIVSPREILERESQVYGEIPRVLPGIDLREEAQVELMKEFASKYYDAIPFPINQESGYRYYFRNKYFIHADATTLYCMLRHYKPKHVIEVGSGFSSAVMLDTNDLFLNKATKFTFIEPFPDRLYSLIQEGDRVNSDIQVKKLQDVPVETFEKLGENDILFIDSSHVSKTGSDVNYFLFDIFPKLKPGVIVHIHDIFYPFEYPKEWVIYGNGRFGWNEIYLLRAFLMNQNEFEIIFQNDFVQTFHKEWLSENMPNYVNQGRGGSLWLRKL
ncbi:class I SAM-dependent methyltransferase [Dyadobacter sp. CY312]|uniref:class I SAM-dependent methyltransferase n=1 Tax=Dyadobacter sp. CY312 TaxID=2907303 RepID=UPI001F34890A|nr:class I SAM-dependent methyltransferase [Dyadobacter sp. CY312]MCE7043529.1 class I SAM-dependent methyltransferase [Dyadobacter sp. CY312]